MEKENLEYGRLTNEQKSEAVDLFLEGFGHFMTFSKDETGKKNLFTEIFDPELFMCYLEEDGLPPLRYAHDDTTHTMKAEK